MIIPLPLVGLALASTVPMQKKSVQKFRPEKTVKPKKYYRPVYKKSSKPFSFTLPKSLENIFKGISSSLSRVMQRKPSEDYDAVLKGFIPEGARLLIPQYPVNSGKYILADLDGDDGKELIASYRLDRTNTTLVLKKQNEKWEKTAEAINSKYESINFLGSIRANDNKSDQLLIGWKNVHSHGELLGYTLRDGKLIDVFTHKYNYLELLNPSNTKTPNRQAKVALWNLKGNGAYDVEVKSWNGSELVLDGNQSQYYASRVLPYYARLVKKTPHSPSNWLNLAEALENAGLYRDSLTSVNIGMELNPDSTALGGFKELKERVMKKI